MTGDRKPRRVLCNDDGWIMSNPDLPLTVKDLREKMVATYDGTPVDALFWCVGDHEVYRYETRVGEVFGESYEGLDEAGRSLVENMRRLVAEGGGPLTALTDLCHDAGLDIFASVRMNSHYETDPGSPSYGRFRTDHPDALIGKPGESIPEGSIEWGIRTGVDYAHPEVRAHMAAVINELFEGFEIDGVELDFMRHPAFFRVEEAYGNRYLMTDLLRHVRHRMREIGEAKGRRQELAVRVPPTLRDSARIGLDVAQWMAEGLVDIVIAGGGFIPFETPIEEFVEAAKGTDCLVYGCIENLRPAVDDQVIRAIASRFWSAGASGIHLFNYYSKPLGWKRRVLGQIADPDALRRLDKRYHMEWTDRLAPSDQHDYTFRYAVPTVQLPVTLMEPLSTDGPTLRMKIAEDLESAQQEGALGRCTLRLRFENFTAEDELEVRLNEQLLSSDSSRPTFGDWSRLEWTQFPSRLAEVTHTGGSLEFDVDTPPLREGENEIELRLVRRTVMQPEPLVLKDVELAIAYNAA